MPTGPIHIVIKIELSPELQTLIKELCSRGPSGNNEPQVVEEAPEVAFGEVYAHRLVREPNGNQISVGPDDLDRLIEEDSEDEEFRNAYEEAIQKVRTNITRRQREALQQVPGEVLESDVLLPPAGRARKANLDQFGTGDDELIEDEDPFEHAAQIFSERAQTEVLEDQQEALDRFGSGDDELIEDVDFVDHVNERIRRDSSNTFEDVSGLEEYNDEPPTDSVLCFDPDYEHDPKTCPTCNKPV